MSPARRQNGFTLVEIAVVLVIIGLIIGSVLVGRDMIASAQLRSLIAEKDKFTTAVNTFALKYNCLAGDCDKATSLFSGVANGDGNGSTDVYEFFYASYELSLAQLVEFPLNTPLDTSDNTCNSVTCMTIGGNIHGSTKRNDLGWIYLSIAGNYLNNTAWNHLFCGAPTTKNAVYLTGPRAWYGAPHSGTPVISGRDAQDIDTKIDDGKPFTGNMIAGNSFGGSSTFASMSGGCTNADYSSGAYNTSNLGNGIMFRNEVK